MTPDDLTQLFDRPVIVTEITDPAAAPKDALVLWKPKAQEGVCVQPLHTALDRAALAARIERIREEFTTKG